MIFIKNKQSEKQWQNDLQTLSCDLECRKEQIRLAEEFYE